MSASTEIEWTDATWTPIRARRRDTGKVGVHCERVSEACKNCYAAAFNLRELPNHGTGLDFVRENREKVDIFVDEKILMQPLHWKRPRKIFVCSQTDLFGEFVTDEMIDSVFAVMALCPQHTFQVLTKRPERMREYLGYRDSFDAQELFYRMGALSGDWLHKGFGCDARIENFIDNCHSGDHQEWIGWPLPNVWLGVTAEDQKQADARIPSLLNLPAAKRFVSVEPMLGPVDLGRLEFNPGGSGGPVFMNVLAGTFLSVGGVGRIGTINWVIAGGESGRGARPSKPDWVRSLRDQCVDAGVPFFFKQWGEFCDWSQTTDEVAVKLGSQPDGPIKLGKKAAGRLLDGVEWKQFPGGAA